MTINCAGVLVEEPGAGLLTVKAPMPWFCRSAAVRATCNEVELATVVGRADPFHNATELDSNPVPIIIIVAGAPGRTVRGEMEVIAAVGLVTLKVAAGDVPPPGVGFCVVIELAELPLRAAAGTVAFTSVALTKVVVSVVVLKTITVDDKNPVPVMSNGVSPDPATTLAGVILLMAGVGSLTEKSSAADVPPPGAGFTTVSLATAAVVKLLAGRVAPRFVAEVNVVATARPFN